MSGELIAFEEPEELPGPPLDTSIRRKPLLPPLQTKPTIEGILQGIFPPIYTQQHGKWYMKKVSSKQPSREDLKQLQKVLEGCLVTRQASKSSICSIREDIHNELMDQLIRQCTINCPERGLLLMRVRDNLKMTFASYQTLYQGSCIFGNRKAYAAEQGIPELQTKIDQIKKKIAIMQNKKLLLQNELQTTEKSFKEVFQAQQKRKADELHFLNQQTKEFNVFLANYRI